MLLFADTTQSTPSLSQENESTIVKPLERTEAENPLETAQDTPLSDDEQKESANLQETVKPQADALQLNPQNIELQKNVAESLVHESAANDPELTEQQQASLEDVLKQRIADLSVDLSQKTPEQGWWKKLCDFCTRAKAQIKEGLTVQYIKRGMNRTIGTNLNVDKLTNYESAQQQKAVAQQKIIDRQTRVQSQQSEANETANIASKNYISKTNSEGKTTWTSKPIQTAPVAEQPAVDSSTQAPAEVESAKPEKSMSMEDRRNMVKNLGQPKTPIEQPAPKSSAAPAPVKSSNSTYNWLKSLGKPKPAPTEAQGNVMTESNPVQSQINATNQI